MTSMIEVFHNWLRQRYQTIQALNGAWRTHYASIDDIRPPALPGLPPRDALPPLLDWLRFCDEGSPLDRPQDDLFMQFPARPVLKADPHDPFPRLYEHVRLLARQRLADGSKRSVDAVVARAMKFCQTDSPALRSFAIRAALMHGAAIVPQQSEQWSQGEHMLADFISRGSLQSDRKLLVLYPRIYAHLRQILACPDDQALAAGEPPATVAIESYDFGRPLQTEGPALYRKLLDLTDRCGFPWEAADTRLPLENLLEYALVVCPTLEMLDQEAMQLIDGYVAGRGYAAIGPRIPIINQQLRGDRTLARHFPAGLSEFAMEITRIGDGAFFTLPGHMSAATVDFLCFESGLARGLTATQPRPTIMQPEITAPDEDVDVVVHRHGRQRLVFVANPTRLPRTADLAREPVRRLLPLELAADAANMVADAERALSPIRLTVPPDSILTFIAE